MKETDSGMITARIEEYGNPNEYTDQQLGDLSLTLKLAYENIQAAWNSKHLCPHCNYSRSIYAFTLGNGKQFADGADMIMNKIAILLAKI